MCSLSLASMPPFTNALKVTAIPQPINKVESNNIIKNFNCQTTTLNTLKVSSTGGLVLVGAFISSEKHLLKEYGLVVLFFGALLYGSGNGLSTYFSWDNGYKVKLLELEKKVKELEAINFASRVDVERGISPPVNPDEECIQKVKNLVKNFNYLRFAFNCARVLVTGSLSFASVIVSGHPSSVKAMGVGALIFGALVSGTANALSTYLGWNNGDHALLMDFKGRIKILEGKSLEKKKSDKEPLTKTKIVNFIKNFEFSRWIVNTVCLLITGGFSFLGSILVGSSTAYKIMGIWAIILGSIIGGIANALSTAFSWKSSDEKTLASLREKLQLK